MGTTINSTATNNAVHVFRCPGGDVLLSLRYGSAIYVREADLKAALGIDELGCGCDEADDNLAAAIRRAEDAEAFGAAAVARAEKAEAAIQRVRDVRFYGTASQIERDVRAAIDPKPAFTLPTEAGARFEARNDYRGTITFRTVLDGPGQHKYLYEGKDVLWTGESVMEELTDHRLLGADQ